MLHNKLPGCYCDRLTLLLHPHWILKMDKVNSNETLLVKFAGQMQWTLQICLSLYHMNILRAVLPCLLFIKHSNKMSQREYYYDLYCVFFCSSYLSVSFVSISQGLGGGPQSDLLITLWLTLSLMLWWGLMDAGILWKVRRQQTKGVNRCLKA